nr:immunoglobulin heavy chain junction region [Mus musculus]
CSRGRMDYW